MRPALLVAVLGLWACGAPAGLRSDAELVGDCYGFPEATPDPANFARLNVRLQTGAAAVDFTLPDASGRPVRLAELLMERPVLLVQGNLTCPRFQEQRAALEQTVRTWGDRVTMVMVYNIEAHPGGGDPSPYTGAPWALEYSDRAQPRTAAEREASARELAASTAATVLVDRFDAPKANPIWCTYGTCPSCAWLVKPGGEIALAQQWYEPEAMNAELSRAR